jgi:hypothetical protein
VPVHLSRICNVVCSACWVDSVTDSLLLLKRQTDSQSHQCRLASIRQRQVEAVRRTRASWYMRWQHLQHRNTRIPFSFHLSHHLVVLLDGSTVRCRCHWWTPGVKHPILSRRLGHRVAVLIRFWKQQRHDFQKLSSRHGVLVRHPVDDDGLFDSTATLKEKTLIGSVTLKRIGFFKFFCSN